MTTDQKNTLHAGNMEGTGQGVSSVQSSTPSSTNTANERPLWIATAPSCQSPNWTNEQTTWPKFAERLAQVRRVNGVTVEAYAVSSKKTQGEKKDVGGFVGGQLKDGKRRSGHVICRSVLALDIDDPTEGFLERMQDYLDGRAAVVYSTFSHRPDNPRYRAVMPLARDVSATEYETVARAVAAEIDAVHGGNSGFDRSTYEPHRLMYWHACPADGEPYCRKFDGEHLEPSDYLNRAGKNGSTTAASTGELVPARAGQLDDPRTKPGLVGLFCRAYDVPGAIETFLSDVYAPSGSDDRYTYLAGSTEGGLVVYDGGQWAYSNHSSDPAAGGQAHCRNAFDLVRIHKFGHLDDEVKPGTHVDRRPSHRAMEELALNDDRVKAVQSMAMASEFSQRSGRQVQIAGWEQQLDKRRDGRPENSLTNFALVLENDLDLQGLAWDMMNRAVCLRDGAALPWDREPGAWEPQTDMPALAVYLAGRWRLAGTEMLHTALIHAARLRRFHPVREYLDTLPEWDRTPRLDTLLVDYMGAPDTDYTRAVTRKTLVAAVARVFKPGIKFDNMLVLDGAQGLGKSTLFARLAREWFSDSLTLHDMKDRDAAAEKLQGNWILEIAELAGIRKTEVETVKGFLSRRDDKYRQPYAKVVEAHPRQCVLVGTTNADAGYLRDTTGNRRFWPVSCAGGTDLKPWHLEPDDVAKLWAEALHYFREGEELYLTGELEAAAQQAQRGAVEVDDRAGIVEVYLNRLLPEQWKSWGLERRRMWLRDAAASDEFAGSHEAGTQLRNEVSRMEIWAECFGKDPADFGTRESKEVGEIMAQVDGWEYTDNKKKRLNYHRQVRLYVRSEPPF